MNILHMWGGVGNQLFIYALYQKYLSMGIMSCIDIDTEYYRANNNKNLIYQLDKLGLEPAVYNQHEELYKYLTDRSAMGRIKRLLMNSVYNESEFGVYNPLVLKLRDKYISGYFQTDLYFRDIAEKIKSDIHFDNIDDYEILKFKNKMHLIESVSIHVRLTDYLKHPDVYGHICTPDYYMRAIDLIKEKVSNPVFFLFSDDVDGAQNLFKDVKMYPIDINHGEKSYLDMYLMSQCKYHIVANSSFSWWGAWLGQNSDKIVIAPKIWANNAEMPDVCPKEWIRL